MTEMSVTRPVSQAMDHARMILFRPFDLGKWFVIGFGAWLATLGEGGGFPGGFHFGGPRGHGAHNIRAGLEQARDYVLQNLAWIVPLVSCIILVSFAIWLVVLWLSSRGRFMFLHCVALNTAEVQVPWTKFAAEANSLFLFRLVISLLGLLVVLPLVGGFLAVVLGMALSETVNPVGILLTVGLVLVMTVAGIVLWVIGRLLDDFVVPLQFLRRSGCLDAWRELRRMYQGTLSNLALYLLFRIVLAIVIAIVVIAVVLATCCLAGCLMALPYLGTVFLLPVLVFERAYPLFYLQQFGPDYDLFPPPATDNVSGMASA